MGRQIWFQCLTQDRRCIIAGLQMPVGVEVAAIRLEFPGASSNPVLMFRLDELVAYQQLPIAYTGTAEMNETSRMATKSLWTFLCKTAVESSFHQCCQLATGHSHHTGISGRTTHIPQRPSTQWPCGQRSS